MPTTKHTAQQKHVGTDHPGTATLEQFAEGRLSAAEAMRVANHLMGGCSRCSGVLGRREPRAVATPRCQTSDSRDLVDSLARLPGPQAALRLENSARRPAPEIAAALLDRVDSDDESLDRPVLLQLAAQALERSGGDDDERRNDQPEVLENLVEICRRLAQEAHSSSDIEAALEVFERADRLAGATSPALVRGRLLAATASLLERASTLHPNRQDRIGKRLPAADRETALVRAHQLLALSGAHREHALCGLRLAEIALSTPPAESTPVSLEDIEESLVLHIRRLDADSENRLALIARRTLLAVRVRCRSWPGAVATSRELEAILEDRGDVRGSFQATLDRGRIHRVAREPTAARHCFLAARNGLLANGWVIDSAIAAIELAILALESDGSRHDVDGEDGGAGTEAGATGCVELADHLIPLFNCDALEGESLAALLVLRESTLEGTVSLEELDTCRAILCDLL